MTSSCRALIDRIDYDNNFDPGLEDFVPAIQELYLDKNTNGVMDLVDSFARLCFNSGEQFHFHLDAYRISADYLDHYFWETGNIYKDKVIGDEVDGNGNAHQIFYRDSFSYMGEEFWDLQTWHERCPNKHLN